ncbi:MAG TPA: nucleotidyltransferase [Candidatus Paceibacterota bacterium]|jgi:hypothetical protein|nr:nucleotidyltransferase [Candidatus Paceibacterota bacterium]
MTEILKIGRLLKTDKDGFIVSESGVDKLKSPWKEAVADIKQAYLDHLGDVIHSIYVRGTVSRGEAIEGISDIDTFAVITKKYEEIDRSWVDSVQKELEQKYAFSTGIEMGFISYDEVFDEDEFFGDRFTIKTQSACIYGEDLAEKIPPFRADLETASHFHRNLENIIQRAKEKTVNNPDSEDIKMWCRWVMKRIIRAGFVLVMDKEQAFTRDLYPSYEVFSKYYPEQEENMKMALELAINPTDDVNKLAGFLDTFGKWVAEQVEKKFEK